MSAEHDEVDDGEWLLRRIPEDQGPTTGDARPSHLAFRPHRTRDADGLSLYRESMVTPSELAGWGRTGKNYFVARVRVSAIRELGMRLVTAPDHAGRPGHIVIPQLNSATRSGDAETAWQIQLTEMCSVEGPFEGQSNE